MSPMMESMRSNADVHFFMQWPFGILMACQTIFSLISLIIFYFAPFLYEGTSFVILVLTMLLMCSIVHNFIHFFGFHRRVFVIANRSLFIPSSFMVTCSILTLACTRIIMMLFRAAPNGQIKALVQVIIEGDRTAKLAATTTTTTTTTTRTAQTNFV